MKLSRMVLPLAVCAAALAQTPAVPKADQAEGADTKIVVSTINIVAPVLVTDRQGQHCRRVEAGAVPFV